MELYKKWRQYILDDKKDDECPFVDKNLIDKVAAEREKRKEARKYM